MNFKEMQEKFHREIIDEGWKELMTQELSDREKKLLTGMIHFAKLYNESNPDVGFGNKYREYVAWYLTENEIIIQAKDFIDLKNGVYDE